MDLVEARLQGFESATRHPWERARLAIVSRLISRYAPIAPGTAVIDVGCGDTFVAESLAKQYPSAHFFAVDSAFTPALITTFTARLTVSNLSLLASLDVVPTDRAASIILLMDVLEHVDDDRGLLRNLLSRSFFRDSTRLLITVPSYAALFCAHDRFLGHFRRYTTGSLQVVLGAAGLEAVRDGHFFLTLVPARLLQLLKERVIGTRGEAVEGISGWRSGDSLARLLAGILEWDGRLGLALGRLGLSLPGLSNFAICRRSA
ncbi:MAG: methyltransferase domain-containing protein [Vicinamibacterales bacterium]